MECISTPLVMVIGLRYLHGSTTHCRGRISPLTKEPVLVVAAGGIFDGRGLAMALSLGASAVWVRPMFMCMHMHMC